jgi:hypothetical protein
MQITEPGDKYRISLKEGHKNYSLRSIHNFTHVQNSAVLLAQMFVIPLSRFYQTKPKTLLVSCSDTTSEHQIYKHCSEETQCQPSDGNMNSTHYGVMFASSSLQPVCKEGMRWHSYLYRTDSTRTYYLWEIKIYHIRTVDYWLLVQYLKSRTQVHYRQVTES